MLRRKCPSAYPLSINSPTAHQSALSGKLLPANNRRYVALKSRPDWLMKLPFRVLVAVLFVAGIVIGRLWAWAHLG